METPPADLGSDPRTWRDFLVAVPVVGLSLGLLAWLLDQPDWASWAWAAAGIATGERWDRLIATDQDGRPVAAIQWQLVSPVLGHPLAYAPHGPVWPRGEIDAQAALGALMEGAEGDSAFTRLRREVEDSTSENAPVTEQ